MYNHRLFFVTVSQSTQSKIQSTYKPGHKNGLVKTLSACEID